MSGFINEYNHAIEEMSCKCGGQLRTRQDSLSGYPCGAVCIKCGQEFDRYEVSEMMKEQGQ